MINELKQKDARNFQLLLKDNQYPCSKEHSGIDCYKCIFNKDGYFDEDSRGNQIYKTENCKLLDTYREDEEFDSIVHFLEQKGIVNQRQYCIKDLIHFYEKNVREWS